MMLHQTSEHEKQHWNPSAPRRIHRKHRRGSQTCTDDYTWIVPGGRWAHIERVKCRDRICFKWRVLKVSSATLAKIIRGFNCSKAGLVHHETNEVLVSTCQFISSF